jgi:hypothetical protein
MNIKFYFTLEKIANFTPGFGQDPEVDLDPEMHSSKRLYPDLDPHIMNADQKHWHPHSEALVLLHNLFRHNQCCHTRAEIWRWKC